MPQGFMPASSGLRSPDVETVGLSIVNPVKAGPIDLEHETSNPSNQPACDCLVVRAKIEVNLLTTELTVTTDPAGPHAIPTWSTACPCRSRRSTSRSTANTGTRAV
jgi:hypothetical protein